MDNLEITRHAGQRIRQRGYCERHLDLILDCATRMNDSSFMLSNQDVQREIELRKKQIQILERSRGTRIVIEDGHLITIYRDTRSRKHK